MRAQIHKCAHTHTHARKGYLYFCGFIITVIQFNSRNCSQATELHLSFVNNDGAVRRRTMHQRESGRCLPFQGGGVVKRKRCQSDAMVVHNSTKGWL